MEINHPEVHAELSAVFARYEDALVNNRVEVLDELFWDSPHTVRYGAAENLVGIEAIRAFRQARSPAGLARSLLRLPAPITMVADRPDRRHRGAAGEDQQPREEDRRAKEAEAAARRGARLRRTYGVQILKQKRPADAEPDDAEHADRHPGDEHAEPATRPRWHGGRRLGARALRWLDRGRLRGAPGPRRQRRCRDAHRTNDDEHSLAATGTHARTVAHPRRTTRRGGGARPSP